MNQNAGLWGWEPPRPAFYKMGFHEGIIRSPEAVSIDACLGNAFLQTPGPPLFKKEQQGPKYAEGMCNTHPNRRKWGVNPKRSLELCVLQTSS